jgi:poly(hydroxyalkanoate) granule-associated protein
LGAFSKTQEEGQKVFQALVKEGMGIQKRTMKTTEEKVGEVASRFAKVAGQFQKQANGTWDRLETVFEERVERALSRLGVPTHREISALTKRVEELTAAVEKLSGGSGKKARTPRARSGAKASKSAGAGKSAAA